MIMLISPPSAVMSSFLGYIRFHKITNILLENLLNKTDIDPVIKMSLDRIYSSDGYSRPSKLCDQIDTLNLVQRISNLR